AYAAHPEIKKESDDHALRINSGLAGSPSSAGSFNQRDRIRLRICSIIGTSDRIKEFREGQQIQTHRCARGLINREAFIKPVVVTFKRQSVRYPQVKQLVR